MTEAVTFRATNAHADSSTILRLRDLVYVRDQGRLVDAADTAATFDRFDPHAVYILACQGTEPVGTVKIVPDSQAGLPCEDVVDVGELRAGNRLVEFGHLMTVPRVRKQSIGMALMREAVVLSTRRFAATHVLGDFFVEDGNGLRSFYTDLGFVPMGEPYRDERFAGSPLSVVGALDLAAAARGLRGAAAGPGDALHYFFHDYEENLRHAQ
ncbi:MAG: GNAT family N-acetyltransferase [Streptomyces sp.]|nr:GNAT family N-acetyltransferase [Streptomyces sp.]